MLMQPINSTETIPLMLPICGGFMILVKTIFNVLFDFEVLGQKIS